MLAAATAGVMFAGPSVIGYLPVLVVGCLIFVLGIDLVKEVCRTRYIHPSRCSLSVFDLLCLFAISTSQAVWDTRHKVSKSEYLTIVAITYVLCFCSSRTCFCYPA